MADNHPNIKLITVEDGDQVQDYFRQKPDEPPALVISDGYMLRVSGVELTKWLFERNFKNVIILIGNPQLISEKLNGFNIDCCCKGYDYAELNEAMSDFLDC